MKTIQVAIKVYKDGTLDDLRGHEQDAETLRNLSAEIETICSSGAPRRPSKFDSDLLKTAAKCRDIQRHIRAHMAFLLKNANKGSLWAAVLVSVKVTSGKKLEELLKELRRIEDRMRTGLLAATFLVIVRILNQQCHEC